jgi:2-phospho-L-lactate guanylyltransferase
VTGSADLSRTWALVPLRGLEDAKTRLGAALDAEERLELVRAMASRTLAATRDARGLAGTVLVTADPAAADLAATFGARTLVQRLPGLNAALREARAVAVAAGATATIVLPIDLPAIDAATLDRLLDEVRDALLDDATRPIVALVADRRGVGTNSLLTAPPAVIEPAFGEASRSAHQAAALRAGARFLELGGPLTLDVDTSEDLLAAEAVEVALAETAAEAAAGAGHAGGSGAA